MTETWLRSDKRWFNIFRKDFVAMKTRWRRASHIVPVPFDAGKALCLNGIKMTTAVPDTRGAVSAATVFVFEQAGDVVSARYRGGDIADGYLIGRLAGASLPFRYVQADTSGGLDAGVSDGAIERLSDGRLRLVERFQWITRPGSGTNIFEEVQVSSSAAEAPCT